MSGFCNNYRFNILNYSNNPFFIFGSIISPKTKKDATSNYALIRGTSIPDIQDIRSASIMDASFLSVLDILKTASFRIRTNKNSAKIKFFMLAKS